MYHKSSKYSKQILSKSECLNFVMRAAQRLMFELVISYSEYLELKTQRK